MVDSDTRVNKPGFLHEFDYLTQDASGYWAFHKEKPVIYENRWESSGKQFSYQGRVVSDWKQSLEEKPDYMKQKKITTPRIVCAANRFEDGTIIIGARHWDQFMRHQAELIGVEGYPRAEQGFVDQFGTFYDRKQAWKIAINNNQVIRRCGGDEDGTLYSENLY